MKYQFPITIDAATLSPAVKEIIDNVNETMKSFGHDEKVALRTTVMTVDINTDRPATPEELEKIRKILEKGMTEFLGEYNARVEEAAEISRP